MSNNKSKAKTIDIGEAYHEWDCPNCKKSNGTSADDVDHGGKYRGNYMYFATKCFECGQKVTLRQ